MQVYMHVQTHIMCTFKSLRERLLLNACAQALKFSLFGVAWPHKIRRGIELEINNRCCAASNVRNSYTLTNTPFASSNELAST